MKELGARLGLAFLSVALLLALNSAPTSASVTISSFSAKAQATTILLQWTTANELNNAGFNIFRSAASTGSFTQLNSSLIPTNNPGSIIGSPYSYTDASVQKGQTYYYKLRSVEFSGATQDFGPVNAAIAAPTATNSATPTSTSIPGTPMPTVYNSPLPLSTPPPTRTPFATRMAYVVGQPTLTPAPPSSVRAVSPKSNAPDAASSAKASPLVSENPPPSVKDDSSANDSPGEIEIPSAPFPKSASNLFTLGLIVAASLFGLGALSVGAVAIYFFTRRFVR